MSVHRLWVIGCVLSWFLLGLHMPALHEVVDHGHDMGLHVLTGMTVLLVLGIASTWHLLRADWPPRR